MSDIDRPSCPVARDPNPPEETKYETITPQGTPPTPLWGGSGN